jgi:hypothetical protein
LLLYNIKLAPALLRLLVPFGYLGTIETFCFLIYVLYIKLLGEAPEEPILPVYNDQVENKSQQACDVKVPELETQLEPIVSEKDNKVKNKFFSQANSVVVTESGNFWHQFFEVKILDQTCTILVQTFSAFWLF